MIRCYHCHAPSGTEHEPWCGSRQTADGDFLRTMPNPRDLFEAAAHNVILAHCIDAWKAGHWTLERALTVACVHLAHQNAELMQKAVAADVMRPPEPIVIDGQRFVPRDEPNTWRDREPPV